MMINNNNNNLYKPLQRNTDGGPRKERSVAKTI